jgi:cell fate regulator YaaT (PSP1 superfamily)
LAYENEMYGEIKKTLPKVGTQVKMDQGMTAIVRGLNIIKETVLLEVEGGESYVEVNASEVQPLMEQKPNGTQAKKKK